MSIAINHSVTCFPPIFFQFLFCFVLFLRVNKCWQHIWAEPNLMKWCENKYRQCIILISFINIERYLREREERVWGDKTLRIDFLSFFPILSVLPSTLPPLLLPLYPATPPFFPVPCHPSLFPSTLPSYPSSLQVSNHLCLFRMNSYCLFLQGDNLAETHKEPW